MHILAVEQQPTHFAGGQERSLYEVLHRLKEQPDVQISLCWQEYGELLEEYRTWINSDLQVAHRVFESRKLPVMAKDFFRFYGGYIRNKWNIVYCNQYFDLPFFTLFSRLTGLKTACHLRLMCPEYLSHQYRWGLISAKVLIANSEAVKKSYVEAGIPASKFRVVYNKIDIKKWRPTETPPKNDVPVIGYFGRLCLEKGLFELIEAFGEMEQEAELRIYGNMRGAGTPDDFLHALHQKVTEIGKQTNIIFHPHTDRVQKAIQQCDLVVLPSWVESFGRILLEAMALEIPVVATNVGGVPEVLGDEFSGHLCERLNPQSLRSKLDEFVNWRKTNPDLGMRSRKYVIDNFADYGLGSDIMKALRTAF